MIWFVEAPDDGMMMGERVSECVVILAGTGIGIIHVGNIDIENIVFDAEQSSLVFSIGGDVNRHQYTLLCRSH